MAQQRRPGGAEYRLANGRAALFAEADALMKQPWLVIADLGSRQGQREERILPCRRVRSGAVRRRAGRAGHHRGPDRLGTNAKACSAPRQRKAGELIISREPLTGLDDAARSQALLALVRRKGLELLPWTPELRQWQARVALLRSLDID
ncbi:ATP-dependent helicase HrpB, partial [Pseudomonas syringae pv. actinidiae]|nr:ATP-dependent helicase HrpB [Pseudomonas syringae pv. actinidiae]